MFKNFEFFKKASICAMLFFLGVSLLDKNNLFSFSERFSYVELAFILYLFFFLLNILRKNSFSWIFVSNNQKKFTLYLFLFASWTGLSWGINTIFRDGSIMDLFGMTFRILFYCLMAIIVARWVKKYGPELVVIPFCCGILAIFYFNFFSAAFNLTTIGIPYKVVEKNFSGVLLPVAAIFLSLIMMIKPRLRIFLLMWVSYASTLLVYSLGGYLFMLFGFPAVFLATNNFFSEVIMSKRLIAIMLVSFFAFILSFNLNFIYKQIYRHISNKIYNIPYTKATKGTVQSGNIRLGYFISGFAITINNPIFGVGEYNFEQENLEYKNILGNLFLDNENPHNSIIEIFTMFGIPAFFLFMMCFYLAFKQLYNLEIKQGLKWKIFVFSSFLVFFGTANVMATIFTTYYFYFFAALIFGIEERFNNFTIMKKHILPGNTAL